MGEAPVGLPRPYLLKFSLLHFSASPPPIQSSARAIRSPNPFSRVHGSLLKTRRR